MNEVTPALQRARVLQTALIILLFFATALNYLDRQVLSLLKPTLQAEFKWSDSDFALLGSTSQFAAAGALLFVGWFVDRFGVRLAFALAVVVWSLAGMAHAASSTVAGFMIARVILIVAESVNTPAAVKAAALYMPIERRSMCIGVFNTASNIGAILAPLLIPLLAGALGWHAAFIITGALGFVWLAFWMPVTKHLVPIAEAGSGIEQARASWGEMVRDRRTWAVAIAKMLTDQVWWFLLFWTPDMFTKVFKLSQSEIGYPTAIVYLMAALGALTSGWLFPKLLRRGYSVNRSRKTSMLLYACLILPIPLALQASSPWVAAVIIGLALFAHQGFSTNIFGMTADIVPAKNVGSVIAFGAVFGNLAGMGIIQFTGYALDTGIGYWPMFAMASVAYLLALAWIHFILPVIRPSSETV